MTDELCALKECTRKIGETFWSFKGQKYHSATHAGMAAVQPQKKRKQKKPKHSKEWRNTRRRFEKETRGVNWEEKPAIPVPPTVRQEFETVMLEAPWAKVKYDKRTFIASEVVILNRVTPDDQLTMMLGVRNVRMYLDDAGGMLIRPVESSTRPINPLGGPLALVGQTNGQEHSVEPREKKSRQVAVSLTGMYGLNPAKEGTKRWFLVEAMLGGGTVKEIFKEAANLFHTQTNKPRTEFGMVATPSNMKLMYHWLKEKLSNAGKEVEIKERDGKYKVKL
jgi:hypothetical protein